MGKLSENVKGTVSIFGIGSFSVQGHSTAVLISQKPGLRFVSFALNLLSHHNL
jgi:hypothetical protein